MKIEWSFQGDHLVKNLYALGALRASARPRPEVLTVASFDVVGGLLVHRGDEHVGSVGMFDHFTHEHENTLFAGASHLRHVVGHDQDRALVISAGRP